MAVVAGPFIVVVLLLGVAGAFKLYRPVPTTRALAAIRLPSSALAVRAVGAAELVVAAGALVVGGRIFAALVAGCYLVFAAFVAAALRTRALSSCGCFGVDDTPPTVLHLVMNLCAAGVAGIAAAGGAGWGGMTVPDSSAVVQAVFLFLVAVSAYLAYVALTLLPRVLAQVPSGPSERGAPTTSRSRP